MFSPRASIVKLLVFVFLIAWRVDLVLICFSLIMSPDEHLLKWLLVIQMSSFKNCPINICSSFNCILIIFFHLILGVQEFLITFLSHVSSIFSSQWLIFNFVYGVLCHTIFHFNISHLSIFSIMVYIVRVYISVYFYNIEM